MYICTKCSKMKSDEDFAMILNRKKERVRQKQCRECVAKYKRKHYDENREKYLEKSRKQYFSDVEYWSEYNKAYREKNKKKISERIKEYTKQPEVRERINERFREYRQDPEFAKREKARGMVNKRVQSKKIIRPNKCSVCKEDKRVEAHHEDYDKPLEVIWVCKECHENIHHLNEGRIS